MAKSSAKSSTPAKKPASAKTSAPIKTTLKTGRPAPANLARGNIGQTFGGDPFVTGEQPLPPGFILALDPRSGKMVPIPETHMFDANGYLVPISTSGTSPAGINIQFNTGNPQLDDFLNNTWLPLVQAEFAGDPTSILNDDIFKKVEERVNATYGPIFQNELNLIEGGFGRSFRELEAQQVQGIQEAETGRTRTLEDVGTQKERIARSYGEALDDSRAALASRGLAFGGTREKVESGLEQQRQTQIGEVERAGQRILEDITTQSQNLGLGTPLEQQLAAGQYQGALGRSLEGLVAGRTQSQQQLEGEKVLQIEAEKSRLRGLGGQLLANPNFLPTI